MSAPADPVAAYLAEVRERAEKATPGPWWSDQSEDVYRLHGVAFRTPPPFEQVVNKQIAKAAKTGTPYAEYWPDAADDAFITSARSDVPRLLAAVEAVIALHTWDDIGMFGSREVPRCEVCISDRSDYPETWEGDLWPCPTLRAIAKALGVEDVNPSA